MSSIGSFISRMSAWEQELYDEVRKLEETSGYSIKELIELFEQGYEIARRGD